MYACIIHICVYIKFLGVFFSLLLSSQLEQWSGKILNQSSIHVHVADNKQFAAYIQYLFKWMDCIVSVRSV